MFFATPHYGLSHQDWVKYVANLVTVCSGDDSHLPTANMLGQIQANCGVLSEVTEDFEPLLGQDFGVVSFSETDTIPALGTRDLIVTEDAARLHHPDEEHSPLTGDHFGLCKFRKDEKDLRFEYVGKAMKRLLASRGSRNQKLHHTAYLSERQRTLLSSLCTDMFHEYYRGFDLTDGTCRWIEHQAKFQGWQEGRINKLCISGDPACGKTHMAAYIVSQVMLNRASNITYLQCFLSRALPERRDCCSILRSTIHQISKSRPDLIKNSNLQDIYNSLHKPDQTRDIWDIRSLSAVWQTIMSEAAKSGRLSIIIDGFNEISSKDGREFLNCFKGCQSMAGKAHQDNLQLLIVTRPDARLDRVDGFRTYDITEQDVAADIGATVSAGLSRFASFRAYTTEFQSQVCEKITEASRGVYLWASLVISDLEHRLLSQGDLEEELRVLPREIAELYDSILGRLNSKSGDVKRILRWVVLRQETLKAEELNIAVALSKLRDKDKTITEKSIERTMVEPTAAKISLYLQCGQLIRFTKGGSVGPIHDSLTEYLSTPPGTFSEERPDWKIPNHRFFYIPAKESHGILGNLCVQYLTMSCFRNSGAKLELSDNMNERAKWEGMVQWENKVRERVKTHEFVRYAALCWSRHLQEGGSSSSHRVGTSTLDIQGQEKLESTESSYAICWSEVWWLFRRWPRLSFPEDRIREEIGHMFLHKDSGPGMADEPAGSLETLETGSGSSPAQADVAPQRLEKAKSSCSCCCIL
ncbi:hypothetical protein B0H67DRAFT_2028 [Lasiosphaeris hirsuta]|uniref:Nephrocystin 3-like N-terminal domain-containing protein n=1 Tax=Lasiosphaeris hirsuta TaxID=260670 RepID=A0AA40B8C5_9PEZI|nr:hypothetical protein B0H67DRAFT_2028 [Lasiosphaeris hirsuta]